MSRALNALACAALIYAIGTLVLQYRRDRYDERQAKLRELDAALERDE